MSGLARDRFPSRIFLALCFLGLAPLPARSALTATASSQQEDYRASNAIDGDPGTRWGSGFGDNEWLQVDLGDARLIGGFQIRWEAAYGRDYDVSVSQDGISWERAASVREGDGGLDEVWIAPRVARFVRLNGVRRGTGWGYSIFEFTPLGADQVPTASASSFETGYPADFVVDGDPATEWRPRPGAGAGLRVDFPSEREIGGVELWWGDRSAQQYSLLLSKDGESWQAVAQFVPTDGGRDILFFPRTAARYLRLAVSGPPGLSLRDVVLHTGEPEVSLERKFEALASRLPDGALPAWLKRRQTHWSIAGVPGDEHETLLGDEGTIEPLAGSFSVMPFLYDPRGLHAPRLAPRRHRLEDGSLPIPTVEIDFESIVLEVTAVGLGSSGKSSTAVRYRVSNRGREHWHGILNLAVWPLQLNPPWQYGGASPIRAAKIESDGDLIVNGRRALVPVTSSGAYGLFSENDGAAWQWMKEEAVPHTRDLFDSQGSISAVYKYPMAIEPGGSRDVVVLFPLHDTGPDRPGRVASGRDAGRWMAAQLEAARKAWRARLGSWKISAGGLPLEQLVRSSLGYMILNADFAAAQPGPRNYAKAWMRDGAVSTMTYLRFGITSIPRSYLDWFSGLVGDDGFVPFLVSSKDGHAPEWSRDWKEYDSQGEYVAAVRAYLDRVPDRARLARWWPAVVRAMDYQKARIDERRTERYINTEYYGILPESNSHEGYFPGVHSYWDDFWAIRGLEDAAVLARRMNRAEDAEKYRAEAATVRRDLFASFKRVMARSNVDYLAGCAEKGDFDPTSTSIALTACGQLDAIRADSVISAALDRSYDRYTAELAPRYQDGVGSSVLGSDTTSRFAEDGVTWASFTPYEARNIEAMARMGRRDDAARLLEFMIGPAMRPTGWNLLPEVVHPDPLTGSYIGDMPHTWVAADLSNAIRAFFVVDDGDALEIAPGVPVSWMDRSGGVSVRDLPTRFGAVNFTIERLGGGRYRLKISGAVRPRSGFRWKLPWPHARIESGTASLVDGVVRFYRTPATIVVRTR